MDVCFTVKCKPPTLLRLSHNQLNKDILFSHLRRCRIADPDSHSQDHEGVLVPEPTGPPHGAAGEEDAVKVRPRQQLQRGETQAGHLDVDVGT